VKLSEYGILVMSSYDLELFYYRELQKIKQAQAAIRIQSLYRMHRERKSYLNLQALRLNAT